MVWQYLARLGTRYTRWNVDMREVTAGASAALLVKIAAAAATLGLSVVLGRKIGATGTGIYYFAFTIVSVAAVVGRVGLDNVVTRLIAAACADGHWSRARSIHREGLLLTSLGATAVSLFMYAGAPLISSFVPSTPEAVDALRLMSLAIVPTCLAAMYSQSLQGMKRIPSAMAVRSLWTRVLTLVGMLFVSADQGAAGAAVALLAASVLTAAIGAAHWRAEPLSKWRGEGAPVRASELLGSGVPLLWVTLMNMTPTFVPTLLLGHWAGTGDLGVYSIAQRIAFLPGLLLIAVTSIVAPMFAGFYQRGDMASLERVARGAAALTSVVALPFIAVLVFFPGPLLSIVGEEFRAGAAVLAMLAVGQYINVATGSVGNVLMMTGKEKVIRNITVGAAAVNVVLCLLLIPAFGMLGAAVATAIAMGGQNLVAAAAVSRTLGISTLPFQRYALRPSDNAG